MPEVLSIWEQIVNVITSIHPIVDVLDILVVAYLIYHAVRLMRETRAMQLAKGIGGFFALYLVAWLLNMNTLVFILHNVVGTGLVVLAVLFQPELRRALEQLGRSKIGPWARFGNTTKEEEALAAIRSMIDAVCKASDDMSAERVGGLMVIERKTKLGEIIKTGTLIDAVSSESLIANIFFHNAPLHDGAVIFRDARIFAAGCFLPLSDNLEISRELGTRHRAAVGMSENSDAIVVVVSEETGSIAIAMDGVLKRRLSQRQLRDILTANMIPAKPEVKQNQNRKGSGKNEKGGQQS